MGTNALPNLHNAMWPGLVGKGEEEPPISLDKMLSMTAAAEVDGVKFDGVDLFLADSVGKRGLPIGSAVAPVWPPAGGGSAMDEGDGRKAFLKAVQKACHIMATLKKLDVRQGGVVRIDTATGVSEWAADPAGNTAKMADTFK